MARLFKRLFRHGHIGNSIYSFCYSDNMQQTEWTQECTDAVREYDAQLKNVSGKALNVYDFLKWLNESDPTVLEYLPKRSQ